jgi:hypothetical protein
MNVYKYAQNLFKGKSSVHVFNVRFDAHRIRRVITGKLDGPVVMYPLPNVSQHIVQSYVNDGWQ